MPKTVHVGTLKWLQYRDMKKACNFMIVLNIKAAETTVRRGIQAWLLDFSRSASTLRTKPQKS